MAELKKFTSREARARWREVLDILLKGDSDVAITRYGETIAVMIPAEDYAALENELEELRIARIAENIYEDYLADIDSSVSLELVKSELIDGD